MWMNARPRRSAERALLRVAGGRGAGVGAGRGLGGGRAGLPEAARAALRRGLGRGELRGLREAGRGRLGRAGADQLRVDERLAAEHVAAAVAGVALHAHLGPGRQQLAQLRAGLGGVAGRDLDAQQVHLAPVLERDGVAVDHPRDRRRTRAVREAEAAVAVRAVRSARMGRKGWAAALVRRGGPAGASAGGCRGEGNCPGAKRGEVVSLFLVIAFSPRFVTGSITPGGELMPPRGEVGGHALAAGLRHVQYVGMDWTARFAATGAQPGRRRARRDPLGPRPRRAGDDRRVPERRDVPDRGAGRDRRARDRLRPRRRAAVRAERGAAVGPRLPALAGRRDAGRRARRGRADRHLAAGWSASTSSAARCSSRATASRSRRPPTWARSSASPATRRS